MMAYTGEGNLVVEQQILFSTSFILCIIYYVSSGWGAFPLSNIVVATQQGPMPIGFTTGYTSPQQFGFPPPWLYQKDERSHNAGHVFVSVSVHLPCSVLLHITCFHVSHANLCWNLKINVFLFLKLFFHNTGAAVGIETVLWLDDRGIRSSSPGRVNNFHFSTLSEPALGSFQPPIHWVTRAFSPGLKRPGREADHLPPASAEIKKTWVYTSTLPYAFMA
jgi:hypothetical protein